MKKYKMKRKGSILLTTAIAILVWVFIAQAVFITSSGNIEMIKASRVALQAQQYAEIDANKLQVLFYDDLDSQGAHSRQAITDIEGAAGWEDEIIISAEKVMDDDNNNVQRIAIINIYKKGDIISRFTLQVPLSSKGTGIRKGMILSWFGDVNKIPSGWKLCDGTNGTPDLRDRFIVGAGRSYNLSDTGGENYHQLTINEMPSHNHIYDDYCPEVGGDGSYNVLSSILQEGDIAEYCQRWTYKKNSQFTGGNQAHENRPPYYGLYLIIKV